jgi:Flp pilus assembly protein TadD
MWDHRRIGLICPTLLLVAMVNWGCASHPEVDPDAVTRLAPLHHDGHTVTVADAIRRVPRPDLLALDDDMRAFVTKHTADLNNSQVKLLSLHEAVRGAGTLDLDYDPFADGSARETFHRGTANCLAYANLFIALAREAGLDARYQWLEVRPQWSRVSERVQLGLHVNVVVRLSGNRRFMVDIKPLPSREIAGSQEMTDTEAESLYLNNLAMAALGRDEVEQAWLYLVEALELSPGMAHLWVNLGAIYRYSDQHREAEQSYMQALALDFTESSAMTNLAVLYGIEGREEEREYWLDRVDSHRQSNPYYHAWLGDEAASQGDWAEALRHYDRAVYLLPEDSSLFYSRGLIYYQLGDMNSAAVNIEKAIELAPLHSDVEYYRRQLEAVKKARLQGA